MSYRTIKGGSARQTGEDDRNEVIAGLIMMSKISYSRGLRLPIKGLWSAVRKRDSGDASTALSYHITLAT